MKKKLLRFLCSALMTVVCMSVNATIYNGNCGDNNGEPTDAVTWSFDTSTGTLSLTGTGAIKMFSDQGPMAYPWCDYDGSENNKGMEDITTIVIGEGITNIPDYAFAMYEYCTSISLPSTLTSIGNSALEECAFTSITLPEGLETIGDYAFLGSKFSSITLPSTLTSIGGSAFNDCQSLTSITIPAKVTSIGESAFQNCIALETVTMLRATPPTLGDLAFYDYSNPAIIIPALTTINVPAVNVEDYKAATNWSDYAALIVAGGGAPATTTTFTYTASEQLTVFNNTTYFTGATAVKSHEFAAGTGTVVYDGTVTAIADYTFYYNNVAKAKMAGITIPASVETIGKWAFYDCEALASVTFAGTSSLTSIASNAFGECTSLTTIALPESLTTLGDYMEMGGHIYYNGSVFAGSGLTLIEIPKNFTTLYGGGHFADCPLTSLTVNAANTKFDCRDGCNAVVETATNKIVMGCVATTVPDGIEAIGYEAFFGESQPFSLVLPASVTTIEDRAFHWADGLKAITIPSGITTITEETFLSSEGMTDVYCYASPTMIWDGLDQAFDYSNPKSVKFHVAAADLSDWETNFPNANVTFVGDLGAMPANNVDGTYWATYYNGSINMKADANTTVYKAAINGNSLTLTEIDDKVITAGQAVILKSTGASIAMTPQAAASADDYSGNVLEGVDVATAVDANYKYYVLSNEASTLGFYKYTGATLGANKAFIKVADAGAPAFFSFNFGGEPTGITNTNRTNDTNISEVYNLSGQRVTQPTKGLYIVNGKKFVIK